MVVYDDIFKAKKYTWFDVEYFLETVQTQDHQFMLPDTTWSKIIIDLEAAYCSLIASEFFCRWAGIFKNVPKTMIKTAVYLRIQAGEKHLTSGVLALA